MKQQFFCAVLFFLLGLGAATPAQTLAPGKPPLTPQMVEETIDFFQWALGGQFTPEQHTDFTNQCIRDWRKNDQTTKESVRQILELRSKLMAATPEQQAAVHAEVQKQLLIELRKTPNDETSRLLLKVYEQGLLNARNGVVPPAQPPANNAALRYLVGKWKQSSSSSIGYVNRNTGSYAAPSGNWFEYDFRPDGTYIFSGLMQSSLYNCTMRVFAYATGVYRIEGSVLITEEKSHTMKSEDNCNARSNYEKKIPLKKESYQWRIEQGQYGPVLTLFYPDGKKSAYSRVTQ